MNFKFWSHDGQCRWVLCPILVALGLLATGHLVGDWFRKRQESLHAAWALVGIGADDGLRGSSLKSQSLRGGMSYAPGEQEHDEFHCTSACMVSTFLWLQQGAGTLVRRRRSEWFLQNFLALLLSSSSRGALEALCSPPPPPPAVCGACPLSIEGRPCIHLAPILSHLQSQGVGLAVVGAGHLWSLWCVVAECAVVRSELERAVTIVAAAVDHGSGDAAYTSDPRRAHDDDTDLARRTKRQKVDEDYKASVVGHSVSQGLSKTSRALLVADGKVCPDDIGRWDDDHLLTLQAAAWLSFARVEHLSLAGDASRLGNPAEETQVMLACNLESGRACWLPPQALMDELWGRCRETHLYGPANLPDLCAQECGPAHLSQTPWGAYCMIRVASPTPCRLGTPGVRAGWQRCYTNF